MARWPSLAPVPNKPMASVNVKQHFDNKCGAVPFPMVLISVDVKQPNRSGVVPVYDVSPTPQDIWLKRCFTLSETVGLLETGAQDGHLDFHTAPELCATETNTAFLKLFTSVSLAWFRRAAVKPLPTD